jgi:hypothetical protein
MNLRDYLKMTGDKVEMETVPTPSISEVNLENLNSRLYYEMDEPYLSPESGIQRIRRVLHLYGLDFPALYDLEPEGDEMAVDLTDKWRIYILYYLKEDAVYEFFAEVGDENRMNELLSDVEEETEEI